MNQKAWHRSFIGLACLLLFLAGCGTNLGGDSPASHVLTVTRINSSPVYRFPPFMKTVDDSARATKLYDAIKALPSFQGVHSCPGDDGLEYQLTFALQGTPTDQILVAGSGCRAVTLSASDIRMTNEAFWSLFAQTLGVSEAELFPVPLSS